MKAYNFSVPDKTMSNIIHDVKFAKCVRGPVASEIPVFRNLDAEEA